MDYFVGITWWQALLGALAVSWLTQIYGTMRQMGHYRQTLGTITEVYKDGFVGAGNAKGRFGSGVIALVVATPDRIVRKVFLMEGRSVFAKFQSFDHFTGMTLSAIAEREFVAKEAGRKQAIFRAIDQIERASSKASAQI